MTIKIIKFLGIFFISFILCLPVSELVKSSPAKQKESFSSAYIYVRVYENGKWYTYIYENDGVTLVTIIEEEW